MARTLVVKTIFSAADKATKPMNNLTKKFQGLGASVSKASMGMGKIMGGVLGARAVMAGINAIRNGIGNVVNEFKDFDSAITGAGAKFGEAFKRGTKGAEMLRKVARDIGATTEFSATQAAEGLDFLAMAGFNATQSMSMLPGVVDLATSTGMDLARSTDIASDALGAFNLMTKDSTQLQANLSRVMDVMSKTTVTANTDMENLFESVKKGAPSFTAAGQSLETFNAFAGVMANAGIKGAESGTALRNMMLKLASPTGEAAETLKRLGVQTRDSQGNFRDSIDILDDVNKGLQGMGTAQKTAALSTIFGARTVTGINVLLNEGTDRLREYRKELENSTGSSKALADEMRKSLKNSLEKIKSGLIETGFKGFDIFQKAIGKSVNAVSGFVDKMNEFLEANKALISQKVEKIFEIIGKIFERMKPTLQVIGDFIMNIVNRFRDLGKNTAFLTTLKIIFDVLLGTISKVVKIVTRFLDVMTFLSPLIIGVTAGITAYTVAMGAYIAVTKAVALATKLWATAQAILNGTFALSPFGLIAAGIALLTTGIVLLIKNWDHVVEAFKKGLKFLKIGLYYYFVWPWLKAINLLISAYNKLPFVKNKVGLLKGMDVHGDQGLEKNSDLPKSSGARLNSAGINNSNTITNIDKSLLEIKGVNLPGDLAFETSGNSKNITFDLGQNK